MSVDLERATVEEEPIHEQATESQNSGFGAAEEGEARRPAFRITRTELARLLRHGYLTMEEC